MTVIASADAVEKIAGSDLQGSCKLDDRADPRDPRGAFEQARLG
jgi:hypothetical protein